MKKFSSFTLKLKLKRHKLKYQLSDDEKEIQLGGANIGILQWLIMVVFPFSITIIILLTILTTGIIAFGKLKIFLLIFTVFAGILGIGTIMKKKRLNKNFKLIGNGKIQLVKDGIETIYNKSEISEIYVFVDGKNEGLKSGYIYFTDKHSQKHEILGIFDEDLKFLKDDLNYFKDFFNMMLEN